MKNLRGFNNFVVLVPIVLGLTGCLENSLWGFALLSTMITGFVQVVFAMCYAFDNPKDRHIYYYFAGVIVFFGLWFGRIDVLYICWMPPVLALYLTGIFYSNYIPETHEP